MIINRINLTKLTEIFKKVEDVKFNINTQYKKKKKKKSIEEEEQIYYKIDDTKKEQCAQLIAEINTLQIQVPDMYFSLEELEPLNLTFKELEALEPFIKI